MEAYIKVPPKPSFRGIVAPFYRKNNLTKQSGNYTGGLCNLDNPKSTT
jgi:hypothetical protein